jgi:hypothetical protein
VASNDNAHSVESSSSPVSVSALSKRKRTDSPSGSKAYFEQPHANNDEILTPSSDLFSTTRSGSHPHSQLSLGWEQNPYDSDPKLTLHLLELYFRHIHSATYCIFPQTKFVQWVKQDNNKSQDDLMLLYCVLALGSVFSDDPLIKTLGGRLADVGAHALENRFGKYTLQLCQSRLVLGMYHFARGRSTESWDYCGMALRAISALKLNTEQGVTDYDDAKPEYGFDRPTLEECRRRTYWSGFLMDVSSAARFFLPLVLFDFHLCIGCWCNKSRRKSQFPSTDHSILLTMCPEIQRFLWWHELCLQS